MNESMVKEVLISELGGEAEILAFQFMEYLFIRSHPSEPEEIYMGTMIYRLGEMRAGVAFSIETVIGRAPLVTIKSFVTEDEFMSLA